MLLISAARCEVLKVTFYDSRAVQLEWDAIVLFDKECGKIQDAILFFNRLAKFNCAFEYITIIDDSPFRGLVKNFQGE